MVGILKRRRHRLGLMVVLALCLGAGIALLPMTAGAVHDEDLFELRRQRLR